MQTEQSIFSKIAMRIAVATPWAGIGWIIIAAFDGAIDALLAVVLVIILAPIAVFINIVTFVFFKGREVVRQFKSVQEREKKSKEPLRSINYSDLPWWDLRRYR